MWHFCAPVRQEIEHSQLMSNDSQRARLQFTLTYNQQSKVNWKNSRQNLSEERKFTIARNIQSNCIVLLIPSNSYTVDKIILNAKRECISSFLTLYSTSHPERHFMQKSWKCFSDTAYKSYRFYSHTHAHARAHAHTRTRTHARTHTHTHIHTYTHTHTHTHTQNGCPSYKSSKKKQD